MKQIRRIALTELQMLFYSPVAWLILIIFTFQAAMSFCDAFSGFVTTKDMGYSLNGVTLSLYADPFRGFFGRLQGYLYFYIPLLTMGLMSRELSSGSIKLLYSSPINDFQIIIGKFLSVVSYAALMVGIVFMFVVYGMFTVENFDFQATLSGLLGIFLLICTYGAIGLFMSSLTSYQVVAAMGTFAIFALLSYVSRLWQDVAFVREIMYWLSINGRSNEFISGLICSEDVLYFLTVISLFLALSILRLKSVRQKTRLSVSALRYLAAIAFAVAIGYASSRPQLMCYYDTTRTKVRTLTQNSQDIVARMEGKLTVTTYANILDQDRLLSFGIPQTELGDRERFRQYLRFKPDTKLKYVRYYAKGENEESLDRRYPGLTDSERMAKVARNFGLDSTVYRSLEDAVDPSIRPILAAENHRLVKVLERENGQMTVLRVFNDMSIFPSESEISAAFKRMVADLPTVGFVTGHGERASTGGNERDYTKFAQEKTFRYALINQGFAFEEVTLDREIPQHITILVMSDIRHALPDDQMENLRRYIDRGGNMLLAGEPRRQDLMNPVLEMVGVRLIDGRLVKPNDNYPADLIFASPTEKSAEIAYYFGYVLQRDQVVTMPSAAGLDLMGAADKGFEAIPLFVADSEGVWNELETTNFIDDQVIFNPAAGEMETPSIPTCAALRRTVDGRVQKIVILGDADCLSSGEIDRNRNKVPAANYAVVMGSFYWMSDEEAPIDVRRPPYTDNDISVGLKGLRSTKITAMGIIPAIMITMALLVWLRRRGK